MVVPSVTDLDQAIDIWIEICERRIEKRETIKSEGTLGEVQREKIISEVLSDNLTKRLSKKRDFQAVVEAREVVDLTMPGDIVQKRRQIRQNLRTNKTNTKSKERMREDFSRLTNVFIDYMTKSSKCDCPNTT